MSKCTALQCGDVARDTAVTQCVMRAIGENINVQNAIIVAEIIRKRRADFRALLQNHNTVVIRTHAEFIGGTQHPIGFYAANRRLLNRHAIGKRCTNTRHWHFLTDGDIGGAAHDTDGFSLAAIHRCKAQTIGVRVRFDFRYLRNDDIIKLLAKRRDVLHLKRMHGQELRQLLR